MMTEFQDFIKEKNRELYNLILEDLSYGHLELFRLIEQYASKTKQISVNDSLPDRAATETITTFETPVGTFKRGEEVGVWVGNYAPIVTQFYAYNSELEYPYIVYASGKVEVMCYKNCRKIEKKVYTIDQLKMLAAEKEGVSIDLIEIER